MSTRCTLSTCVNGNCPGCRNGALYCNDPRCYPNCTDCNTSTSNTTWILTLVILILLVILLILGFAVGFGWFKDRKKASEPKNITVHRHVHNNIPAPVVVKSSPPPITIKSTPSISSISSSKVPSVPSIPSSIKVPKTSLTAQTTQSSLQEALNSRVFSPYISPSVPSSSRVSQYDGVNLAGAGIPRNL